MWWPGDWPGLQYKDYKLPNYLGTHLLRDTCDIPCQFTQDRGRLQEADGIILEISVNGTAFLEYELIALLGANDHPFRNPPLLPPKFSLQPWIMLSYETKDYFRTQGDETLLANIDLHATYDQQAAVLSSILLILRSLDSYQFHLSLGWIQARGLPKTPREQI